MVEAGVERGVAFTERRPEVARVVVPVPLGPGATVAVFARDRPAVLDDEVRHRVGPVEEESDDVRALGRVAREVQQDVVHHPDDGRVVFENRRNVLHRPDNVVVPDAAASGRAPLSQGMIATAESKAHAAFADLEPYLEDGRDVVVIEPSDLAMFQREYSRLLPTADHDRLADTAYEIVEYVYGLLETGGDASVLSGPGPADDADGVAYHSHCQQRTLGLERHTEAVLDRLGYDVVTSDAECCGMAGSFGYKSEYYELSVTVGEDLAEGFHSDVARDRTVVASGTSCLEQLDSLLDRPSTHPIELIAPDD